MSITANAKYSDSFSKQKEKEKLSRGIEQLEKLIDPKSSATKLAAQQEQLITKAFNHNLIDYDDYLGLLEQIKFKELVNLEKAKQKLNREKTLLNKAEENQIIFHPVNFSLSSTGSFLFAIFVLWIMWA